MVTESLHLRVEGFGECVGVAVYEEIQDGLIMIVESVQHRLKSIKGMHNLRSRRNGHSLILDVNIHVDPDITVRAAH